MVAILFEGKTDVAFFDTLVSHYQLDKDQIIYKNFEGKDNIFNISHEHYNTLEKSIEQERITKLLIIVDADNPKDPSPCRGYAQTQTKLNELKDNLDFNIPVDFYIMCDNNQQGYLESFLLSVLDNTQRQCIDDFKTCFQYELSDKWVYNSFYKHHKHPFDFSHENFNALKQKLQTLFEGIA